MSLIHDLSKRLPDCRLHGKGNERRLVFQADGVWLDARARDSPVIEIYIRTTDLPGWTMRYRVTEELETSDSVIADLWLDAPARVALGAAIATGCEIYYEGGEILVRRASDMPVEELVQAVLAGAAIAARPHRLGRGWLDVARELGGTTTTDRWGVDGEFAATIDRGTASVRIENRLDGEILSTRVSARRVAAVADGWMLAKDGMARRARPKVDAGAEVVHGAWSGVAIDPARLLGRLRPIGNLLEGANPDMVWTDGDEVALWWNGMVMSPAWLGPAVELVAQLAIDIDAALGPYR